MGARQRWRLAVPVGYISVMSDQGRLLKFQQGKFQIIVREYYL